MLDAISRIANGVKVPVTADIEGGYSTTPEGTANSVQEFLQTGIVGVNLEDRDASNDGVLFDIPLQCDCIRAVREMANAEGIHLLINARTDVFLENIGDSATRFARTIERAHAFKEAGADCIFIPGAFDEQTVGELVKEIGAPINILIGPTALSLTELQDLGVARVSSGSGPARASLGFTRKLALQMRNEKSYQLMLDNAIPYPEVNALFDR
jgi:2-methylisocitrate lyase-like PEP mutase family enzyme